MGGALGGLFSKTGQGDDFNVSTGTYAPSTAQKLTQGIAKGAGTAFGQSMQPRPGAGGNGTPGAPAATPVDSGYFAPTAVPPPGSPMTSGAPGMPQRMMPSPQPAFYGQ